MATLTLSALQTLALDRIQANVSTDLPFTTAEQIRFINDAYADVWEISGGALARATGSTVWATQPTSASTNGIFTSSLTTIAEIREVFASTSSSSTGDVDAGDTLLNPVDLSEVLFMRANATHFGGYAKPKIYAVTRNHTTTPGDVNKLRLDIWPDIVADIYLPVHYVPQFTDLDASTVTTPAVNDIESRDIGLLAASRMAPLIGRAELVPSILADISERTRLGLARKLTAMLDAKADR